MRSGRQTSSDGLVVRRHRPMYYIALYIGLLLMLGLMVMYAIGPQRANLLNHAYGASYSNNYFFNKQLMGVAVSVIAFATLAIVPFRMVTEKYAKTLFISGLALGVLLVVFGAIFHAPFATEVNGAYRWFQLGGLISFQPSELLKFGSLVFMAGFLGLRAQQGKINNTQDTLVPLGIALAASLFVVIVLQKDLGTGISLLAIILSMMIVAGASTKVLVRILVAAASVGLIFVISAPHRMERVTTFLQGDDNTHLTKDDDSYHIKQARIAIGSGGLFGLGIGQSVQATGYLPEAVNDSIFAILGETFGFVGLVAILAIFTLLLLSILRVAARLPDMRLRLVAAGVFGWVASHVVLNVAAMTGVAPLTGISLPFLSSGGTSMLFISAAMGLVFQLSRHTSHKPLTEGEASGQDSSSRRRLGRARHASSSSL